MCVPPSCIPKGETEERLNSRCHIRRLRADGIRVKLSKRQGKKISLWRGRCCHTLFRGRQWGVRVFARLPAFLHACLLLLPLSIYPSHRPSTRLRAYLPTYLPTYLRSKERTCLFSGTAVPRRAVMKQRPSEGRTSRALRQAAVSLGNILFFWARRRCHDRRSPLLTSPFFS